MYSFPFDTSQLGDFTLAERLPTLEAMVRIDNEWRAVCPDCGRPLLVYDHDDRPALECFHCRQVWPTSAPNSITGQRHLVRDYLVKPDRIVEVRAAREAA
jgi:hypothetical protein